MDDVVRGESEEQRKRGEIDEERQVPMIHLDYVFMGDEKEWKTLAQARPSKPATSRRGFARSGTRCSSQSTKRAHQCRR